MKSTSPIPVFIGIVLGAVTAAATTTLLLRPVSSERENVSEALSPVPGVQPTTADPALVQLEALRNENQDLWERLVALEARQTSTTRTPVDPGVSAEEFEEFKKNVLVSLAQRGDPDAGPHEMKSWVADALEAVREEEAVERRQRNEELTARKQEGRLMALRDKLGLSDYQVDEVRTAFVAQEERNQELVRVWREGTTDDATLGETKRANADAHQADLERVLSPEQLATYRELRATGRAGK